jgi:hypothetical protein
MSQRTKKKVVRILVTSAADSLPSTTAKLKEHGMKVNSVLNEIGIVTGEIVEENLENLKKIPGIKVEPDESVQIPSPDSPLQ